MESVESDLFDLIVVQDEFIVERIGDAREIRNRVQLLPSTMNVTRNRGRDEARRNGSDALHLLGIILTNTGLTNRLKIYLTRTQRNKSH